MMAAGGLLGGSPMDRSSLALFVLVCLVAACSEAPAPRAEIKPAPKAPAPVVVIPTPAPAPVSAVEKVVETPKVDANKALAERVKHALEEESRIHAAAIDVTATGGTVTLWGTAAT